MYCSRPTCFRKLGISLKFSPFVPCSDCYGFIKGEFASSETYCSVCAGSLFLSIPCMFDTCLAKLYLNADLKLHLVQSNQSALSVLLGFGESSLGLHTLHKNTMLSSAVDMHVLFVFVYLSQLWHCFWVDFELNPFLQLGQIEPLHHCNALSSSFSCVFFVIPIQLSL